MLIECFVEHMYTTFFFWSNFFKLLISHFIMLLLLGSAKFIIIINNNLWKHNTQNWMQWRKVSKNPLKQWSRLKNPPLKRNVNYHLWFTQSDFTLLVFIFPEHWMRQFFSICKLLISHTHSSCHLYMHSHSQRQPQMLFIPTPNTSADD